MSYFCPTTLYYMENYSGNVKTAEVRWVLMCFPEPKRVSLEIPKLNNIESISNYAGYFLALTFTVFSKVIPSTEMFWPVVSSWQSKIMQESVFAKTVTCHEYLHPRRWRWLSYCPGLVHVYHLSGYRADKSLLISDSSCPTDDSAPLHGA